MFRDSFFKPLKTKKSGIYPLVPAIFISLGSVLLFLAGQIIGILIFTILLGMGGFSPEDISRLYDENVFVTFSVSLSITLTTLGMLFGLFRYAKINPLSYLKINKKVSKDTLIQVAKAYGLYFVSFIVIATLGDLILPSLDVDQQQQLGFDGVSGYGLIFVFASLVILPPLTEEILFRGFLYNSLKHVSTKRIAIIITSILFSMAHLEFFGDNPLNFIAAIDTFVLSLFLIWVYEKTNTLWAPIILHGLKNSIAFVVLFVI